MDDAIVDIIHREAGALVVNEAEEILVLVGSDGLWSLPKGHIEPNETPSYAAYREVKEETNVVSEPKRLLRRFSFQRRKNAYELTVFLALYVSGTAQDNEHASADARWIKLHEAFSVPTYDSRYRDCIVDYLQIKQSHGICDLNSKQDACSYQVANSLDSLENHFGKRLVLTPFNEGAKRPLFAIEGEPYTARFMESTERAERCAQAAQLMRTSTHCIPPVEAVDRWLLTKYVPGRLLIELINDSSSTSLLNTAGALLAAIHSSTVPIKERDAAFTKAVSYIQATSSRSLAALERAGFLSLNESRRIKTRLESWCKDELYPDMISPVHWDFVPGNLVKSEGELYLIDFEGSRLFFSSFDLVKACHYLSFFGYDVNSFLDSYAESLGGFSKVDVGEMALFFYMRCLAKRLQKPNLDHRPIEAKLREVLNEQFELL